MDWLAGILELLGGWLVGNKKKVGFISNVFGCSVWIYVALTTHVYGLLIVVVPALFVNTRNYLKWRKEEMANKNFKEKKYMDEGGNVCPYCESTDVKAFGQVQVDGASGYQSAMCNQCESEWTDVYTLTGVEEITGV